MYTSSVTQKGQVTVPVDIRRELGIEPGGKVRFVRRGRQVLLEAVKEPPVSSLFGLLAAGKGKGVADVDAALDDIRTRRARRMHQPVRR